MYSEFLHLPSLWILVIAIIALFVVIKVIRSAIGILLSLTATVIAIVRIYTFFHGYM